MLNNKMKKNNNWKRNILFLIIATILLGSFVIATTYITDDSGTFSSSKINDSGVFYSNQKAFSRTADVVVCRGTSVLDDLYKQFTCDVVCKSTDSDCLDDLNVAKTYVSLGGRIYLMHGSYNISDTFSLDGEGVYLEGDVLAGVSKWDNRRTTLLIALPSFPVTSNLLNISGYGSGVKNLWLDGNNVAKNGIYVYSIYGNGRNFIDYVNVNNFTNDGVLVSSNSQSEDYINNLWSHGNGLHGLEVRGTDWRLSGIQSFSNLNGAAVMLNPGSGAILTNSHPYMNRYGVYMNGSNYVTITANQIEESSEHDIVFDSAYQSVSKDVVVGNVFMEHTWQNPTGQSIIDLVGPSAIQDISVVGNTFKDSAGVRLFTNSSGMTIGGINYIGNTHNGNNFTGAPTNFNYIDYNMQSIQIKYNTTGILCDWVHEGNIYYSGSADHKFYGCNGTGWTAFW